MFDLHMILVYSGFHCTKKKPLILKYSRNKIHSRTIKYFSILMDLINNFLISETHGDLIHLASDINLCCFIQTYLPKI